ncbi:MAG: hypothetical protein ABI556_07820 [Gemmatimonadales bacterium]
MTAPFVTELRVGPDVVVLGGGNGAVLHLKVQQAELWEAIRIDAPDLLPVSAVKLAALQEFYPSGFIADDFIVKLRGYEILREGESLAASGVKDGSTLLLARRRRRPVR